jgi:hypothetical protein
MEEYQAAQIIELLKAILRAIEEFHTEVSKSLP